MTATAIQWTDAVWNPVTGCTKVSAGCKNCYAERLAPRVFAGQMARVRDPRTGAVLGERPRRFTDVLTHTDRLDAPLRWRKPRRVFVNSMSDLFHEDVPDEFIAAVFGVMAFASQHTFQVLTKRPQRMREFFGFHDGELRANLMWWLNAACTHLPESRTFGIRKGRTWDALPLSNVWLGVSCEKQAAADERIPILLNTPAAVRFVSAEPLLGPIDVTGGLYVCDGDCSMSEQPHPERPLDWVIVGGESGPKARTCDVAWIRSIVKQCKTAGVPCFVKQLGANSDHRVNGALHAAEMPIGVECEHGHDVCPKCDGERLDKMFDSKGGDPREWPKDLRVREWPQ